MNNCPTCGQVADFSGPIHDVARRTVTFNGKTAVLGFANNLIFEIMLRRHPLTTHWEAIAGSVWRGSNADPYSNFMTQVCYLRKLLKPLGIRVVSHPPPTPSGFYWLEF